MLCLMPIITEKEMYFNPERDLKAVEPFGFVDLKNALVNGVIESQVADSDENYNGINDPNVIIGKPRDIFDAMQSKMVLNEASVSSKEAESE